MATFNITIPDAVVTRILNAAGSYVQQPDGSFLWTPATVPATAVKTLLKKGVGEVEGQLATTAVSNETW